MKAAESLTSTGGETHQSGFHVLQERILSTFPSGSRNTLPELCSTLLRHQQSSWPQLLQGYSSFKAVMTREVLCNGYSVTVQFNPGRIISSEAKLDPRSISARKCFLCLGNLPAEQKGVLYGDEFLVLCNPAPILDSHLTLAHVGHIPQSIERFVGTFLDLARDLSPVFTVFYNGPKCGASAPDHMHFQASPTGLIPVEKEASRPERRELRKSMGSTTIHTLKNFGRETIVIEGKSSSCMQDVLSGLFVSLSKVLPTDGEPMVNVLCSYHDGQWRLIVFPRRKHRPEFYSHDGDARVLISPAAIDVGGLVVTPLERDFRRVDAKLIQTIFDEVVMDGKSVNRALAAM